MLSASAQSLVAVPFLSEDPGLVSATLFEAASHPAVSEVLGVHGSDHVVKDEVARLIDGHPAIRLIPQKRYGSLRPGKGDAINTAFREFLDQTGLDRLHFYDADIKTFTRNWIEKAEKALDAGYWAVRHFYPRAPTDGMITWMVTRPGFALLWPDSELPRIEQPMSGEVAFTRAAARELAGDPAVVEQSDWGIDTAITHRSVAHGLPIYESFIPEGKDHQLYGSLAELKTMLFECLHTLQRLRMASPPVPIRHQVEEAFETRAPVTVKVAYDIEATGKLLDQPWTPGQRLILREWFGSSLDERVIDGNGWLDVLRVLIDRFAPQSPDWQEVAFRLWARRVVVYSRAIAGSTYEEAMESLRAIVRAAADIDLHR